MNAQQDKKTYLTRMDILHAALTFILDVAMTTK
jgi:hypothetical protein